jgi:hypothetical protein
MGTVAAAGLSVAGTAFQIMGQRHQAAAQEAVADYNSQLAKQQVGHESEVVAENARRKARESAQIVGLQREAIAASGMAPSGSPLAVLGETVMTLERDIMDMGYEAAMRARQLHAQAAMGQWEARQAAGASGIAQVGTLLTGLQNTRTQYRKAKGIY